MPTVSPITPKSFDAFDKIGWKDFAERLERFIRYERTLVEGGLVVSLNAPFGCGKSTFLDMWAYELRKKYDAGVDSQPAFFPIRLNAWESDYCGDALLAILEAFTVFAEGQIAEKNPGSAANLKEAAKDAAWFGVGMAGSFVANVTGLDPIAARDFALARKQSREGADLIKDFREKRQAIAKLKEALQAMFGGNNPVAIVLVDELDRCRPDYAIHYLETIKHVFDVAGLVFVLAVDKHHLRNSAKALFGGDLNFGEYYRRFAHRNVDLPAPTRGGFRSLTAQYLARYLNADIGDGPVRRSYFQGSHGFPDYVISVVEKNQMSVRQIQELFRILGHLATDESNGSESVTVDTAMCSVFLAALWLVDEELYRKVGTHQVELIELFKTIDSLWEDRQHGAKVSIGKAYTNDDEDRSDANAKLLAALKEANVVGPSDESAWAGHLRSYYSQATISSVYRQIQRLMTFSER